MCFERAEQHGAPDTGSHQGQGLEMASVPPACPACAREVSHVSQPVLTRSGARALLVPGWVRNGGGSIPWADGQQAGARSAVGVTLRGQSSHLVCDTPCVVR